MYISRQAKKRLSVLLFVILFAIIILSSDVAAYRKLWDDSKETFFNIINVKEDFDVDEIVALGKAKFVSNWYGHARKRQSRPIKE